MPGKAHSNRAIIASFLSRALHLCSLEAFLTSTVLVALAEIGDKTQLLSFALAAKLRRPYPIMAGILVATLLNHALAATAGAWLAMPDLATIPQLDYRAVLHRVCLGDALAGRAGQRATHLRFRNIPNHAHRILYGGNAG